MQLIGQQRPRKELVQVDISAGLRKAGILQAFPSEVWPPTNAVREVATWISNRRKCNTTLMYTFVNVNLKKLSLSSPSCYFLALVFCEVPS